MQSPLKIYTLGELKISRRGDLIDNLGSRKVDALIVYLAFSHTLQNREALADLLWGMRWISLAFTPASARRNAYQCTPIGS